ncbi:MAG: hypothetical protein HF314_15965 [Ignavibacteria bacterium]|jgi:hypothetical protein|nr:hypothetical protein [Ignavibacteria bacterium]MCU7504577.1 hypothetical protein [Ignavibacteria bacterium]MCU7516585.1 hypothetical protein [Ignavibacteria bacterium]
MRKLLKSVKLVELCLVLALIVAAYSGSVMAQGAGSKKDQKTSAHSHMNMEKDNGKEQPKAYKGVIDLKAVDKNKDGKVYQDQMDWNVLSDKPGTCPLCKMTLEEVSLKQAKDNLKKNGFKVK